MQEQGQNAGNNSKIQDNSNIIAEKEEEEENADDFLNEANQADANVKQQNQLQGASTN